MSELLKASPLNPEQAGYADSIRVCADTLLSIINEYVEYLHQLFSANTH